MLGDTTAVILAGGRASRMGGEDKGLMQLSGEPLVAHVLRALRPQTDTIIISANRNLDRYQQYGYSVITDSMDNYCGPLSGILSAMRHCTTRYLLTVPCDCPFLPDDYLDRMIATLENSGRQLCVAHDGAFMQPVFSLLSCSLADHLEAWLENGNRKTADWISRHQSALTDFSDNQKMFLNMNTPEDRISLEKMIKQTKAQS